MPTNARRTVGIWFLLCAAVVYLMIVVGGITRLTQSGLSMVEWDPIMGFIPPMSKDEWLRVFELYRLSPEYLKVNAGMSLESFKGIFWWEYGHRVLGRFIGLVYFIPLVFFLVKGWIPSAWRLRLFGLFILGGLQGLMGWYMVKSGLVDVPHVSQYRLTAHLGLAVVIFIFMLWYALDFLRGWEKHERASKAYLGLTALSVVTVFAMMLSGGFVAGTKAGFIINTFPTMNGEWVPAGLWAMQPGWRNLFENAVTVQFVHRLMALLVVVVLVSSFIKSRTELFNTYSGWVVLALVAQITLGISALVYVVPVALGAGHQAGAVALLASTVFAAHVARKKKLR